MDEILFKKLQEGRIKYQLQRTKKRLIWEKELFDRGVEDVGQLTQRELFISGVALYWAEGFKHGSEATLGLATLDPKMAMYYVNWLEKCLNIERSDLIMRVTANIAYKAKVKEMEHYWSNVLDIDIEQFRKPFFQKSKQSKIYKNSDSYHGVIRIRIRRGLDLLRKMRGWISGLAQARTQW